MALIKSIIILIIGFALLMKGADYFVEGSSSVAKQLHVPSMIIGMTIVAMGTSLPECAVSVTASLTGNNSLAVSNVVGSNIFNLMVVCGACALFAPLTIKKDTLKKEFPLSIICAALLMVLGYVGMLLGHLDGGVFLLIFAAYLIWMIGSAKKARAAHKESQMMLEEGELVDEEIQILPLWKCALFIVGGMVLDQTDSKDGKNKKKQKMTLTAPYLENELQLIVRGDSKYRTAGSLKSTTVLLGTDETYMTALSADEKLMKAFGAAQRVTGGSKACFEALSAGDCAAIVADSTALAYYTH